MNGAVQGAATATASTPVKNAPTSPLCAPAVARGHRIDLEYAGQIEADREHQQR